MINRQHMVVFWWTLSTVYVLQKRFHGWRRRRRVSDEHLHSRVEKIDFFTLSLNCGFVPFACDTIHQPRTRMRWGTVAAAYSIAQLRSSQVLREISYHRCDCYYLTFFTFTKSPFVLLAHSLSPIIIIMWPTTKVIEQRQIIIITEHFPRTLLRSNRLVLHLCGSPMADR